MLMIHNCEYKRKIYELIKFTFAHVHKFWLFIHMPHDDP